MRQIIIGETLDLGQDDKKRDDLIRVYMKIPLHEELRLTYKRTPNEVRPFMQAEATR